MGVQAPGLARRLRIRRQDWHPHCTDPRLTQAPHYAHPSPACALQATVRPAGRERATISAQLDAQRAIDGPDAEITYKGYVFGKGYCTLTDAGALGAPHPYPAPIAAASHLVHSPTAGS